LRLSGLVAQKAFGRPINAASFGEWVEKCLAPTLSKGDIVIMDNLSSHKGPKVEQLFRASGAELRDPPPYSPDMNPIEKAYSKLKAFLRKIAERNCRWPVGRPRRLRRHFQTSAVRKLFPRLRIRAWRTQFSLIGVCSKMSNHVTACHLGL
jgi:transposase